MEGIGPVAAYDERAGGSHGTEHVQLGGPAAAAVLKPITGVVEFVEVGDQLAEGVCVKVTPGQNPGYFAVVIGDSTGSSSDSLILIGDILHSSDQVIDVSLASSSESDPARARAVREDLLTPSAVRIGAGHFTDQVFGRFEPANGGVTWVPVASPA
jgi:hypothetical protein